MNDTLLAAEAAGAPVSSGGEPVRLSPRTYRLALAAIILLGCVLLTIGFRGNIRAGYFGDPDDLMRLQEVRDWLAGQSWFDVTQYRVNPPHGLPMHWSRLLDVPLGAIILLVRPFVGQATAELVAATLVPLLTFAALAGLVARIARQLSGNDGLALLAAGFCVADAGSFSVAHPLRIDHHGWQAVCALAMVTSLLGERTWRRAAIAGLFAAFWMHISLEGIVFTAACGAWLGLRWAFDPEREGTAVPAYLAGIALGSLAFFVVTHGLALFGHDFCDAVSPLHMILFALATLGSATALLVVPAGRMARLAVLGTTALLCAVIYKLAAPQCSGGPFALLTPLDVRLWYDNVAEGMPVWHQPLTTGLIWESCPFVILPATGLLWWRSGRPALLLDYLALLTAAALIGLLVLRAGALSNILAIPGAVMLVRALSRRVETIRPNLLRIPARALAVLLLLPLTPGTLVALVSRSTPAEATAGKAYHACNTLANIGRLDTLRPGLILADLDFGSVIIAGSHHSVIAANYHRAPLAMDDVLRFFATDEAQARAVVARRRPDYIYICPGANGIRALAKAAPQGMAARLIAGRPPAWLNPVMVPGLETARIYRITR